MVFKGLSQCVFAIVLNFSHSTGRWTKNERLNTRKQLAGWFVICPYI